MKLGGNSKRGKPISSPCLFTSPAADFSRGFCAGVPSSSELDPHRQTRGNRLRPDTLTTTFLAYKRNFPPSVQEAIDFATFLVRTTIDMQRFSAGTIGFPDRGASCGGAVHAVCVTPMGVE